MRKLLKLTGFVALVGYLSLSLAALIIKRLHPSRGGPDDNEVDLAVVYTGLEFASHAAAFRRGSVLTMFGGSQVDLREAALDPAGASLEVHTVFGGTAIIVPEGWRVTLDATSFCGGSESKVDADGLPPNASELTIHAWTLFGGLAVSTRPEHGPGSTGEPVSAT